MEKEILPNHYQRFLNDYPEIAESLQILGEKCRKQNSFDAKTQALLKLSFSIGSKQEGAVHSHVKKALIAGASNEEIRSVVLLSLTTIGFPQMMAALSWVNDILDKNER